MGTLAALAIPRDSYNGIEDRLFWLASKYFGSQNARERETKGKQLLSPYEFRREASGTQSNKLMYAQELLEDLRRRNVRAFASVVTSEKEVDLLCEDADHLDRPYFYLMERVNAYLQEMGGEVMGSMIFDDRGLPLNSSVAIAYRNFLTRSKTGRSFSALLRTPFFAYSNSSAGLQLADLVCSVINRYHTSRNASHRIPAFFSTVRKFVWTAKQATEDGYLLDGIKLIGDKVTWNPGRSATEITAAGIQQAAGDISGAPEFSLRNSSLAAEPNAPPPIESPSTRFVGPAGRPRK